MILQIIVNQTLLETGSIQLALELLSKFEFYVNRPDLATSAFIAFFSRTEQSTAVQSHKTRATKWLWTVQRRVEKPLQTQPEFWNWISTITPLLNHRVPPFRQRQQWMKFIFSLMCAEWIGRVRYYSTLRGGSGLADPGAARWVTDGPSEKRILPKILPEIL